MLIAVGGNALVEPGEEGDLARQARRAAAIGRQIAEVTRAGYRVVLTHGNGPQVGYILRRGELVADRVAAEGLPQLPLWLAVADSQGGIAHLLTVAIDNALAAQKQSTRAVAVLTHTVVDPDDPAFAKPTKPIGNVLDEHAAEVHRAAGWTLTPTGGGYRRVVPSPRPTGIVEAPLIRGFLDQDAVIIAGGGGGIPLVAGAQGWRPVDAVVDKDYTSALLASQLQLDAMILVTGVDHVFTGFGTPAQRRLDEVDAAEMAALLAAGEFPAGSMGPKVDAALQFIAAGGRQAVITSLDTIAEALTGRSGTRIHSTKE